MNWKIPLFKTYSDQEDIEAVSKVIKRGTYWATGPEIEEFEKSIAEFVGTKYAATFNSGTSALHALLLAHDIKGKEVIVPSFTFIATANAVILAGGIPVFVESESETFGLDVEDVKKKITNKTKAVIALHYGGCASKDIEKLREICNDNKLILIEDAAESLGANIKGKNVGTFGDSAMFSFCQNKVISCGEGGIIVTNSKEIYEKIRLIRSHGRVEIEGSDYFSSIKDNDYIKVGFNFRIPTMCAALGLSQLKKIKKIKDMRKEKAKFLNESLKGIKKIKLPIPPDGFEHIYQMYTLRLENQETRDKLQKFLKEKSIMTKVYFEPVHLKTLYKKQYGCKEGNLPKTEELSKKVLTLPIYPDLKEEKLKFIVDCIEDFFKQGAK